MVISPRTIDIVVDVITGGSGGRSDGRPVIGLYRSGSEIERFMRGCNVDYVLAGSRVPSLTDCLIGLNRSHEDDDKAKLVAIVESAGDPRDFLDDPEKGVRVLAHLNAALAFDDLELRNAGGRIRLVTRGRATPIVADLAARAETFDFDTVRRDLDRAMESADGDPEDAVTAACSIIESMCRSVLIELDLPLPAKLDISGLYKAVRGPLGLSPEREDFAPEIADDVRKVLSGLATTIEGVGNLRTHGGDAHGRERGYRRIDARIARLAIHAASTAAVFILETWQHKYPSRDLRKSSPPS